MQFPQRKAAGSVLLVTLTTAAILMTILVSYMKYVGHENMMASRSQVWNLALPVAEAGVEEALTQLHYYAMGSNIVGNGWIYNAVAKQFTKSNQVGSSSYVATIQVASSSTPVIFSEGTSMVPGSDTKVKRRVRVEAFRNGMFMKGMVAKGQINLSGNNIKTDSFDSTDPSYSTNGRYDASKTKDNGDVATNAGLVDSISVGNANIYGHASTGPGGSVSVGANGAIGDSAWQASHTGIQPGWVTDDMNVDFPDITAPFAWAPPPVSGTVGGTNYAYVLGAGNYMMNSLSLGSKSVLLVTNDAVLFVNGSASLSGQAKIIIATNASLRIYANGASDLSGNGVMNYNANATNFTFYGMAGCTSLKLSGNAEFTGTIYAPNAAFTLGGGGNNSYDFVGASVSKTVTMNGHFKFHYDENLGRLNNGGQYRIRSWIELPPGT